MKRLIIPQLDANLIDVTVSSWKKAVGDKIQKGETVAELTTDKAVYELEAPESGELLSIIAEEKSVVPTSYIIALIGVAGEEDLKIYEDNAACLSAYIGESAVKSSDTKRERKERVRATPKARRMARKNGLDLAEIQQKTGAEVVNEAAINKFLEQ